MYKECKICNRVTEHKRVDSESRSQRIGLGIVTTSVFYICPHCNTGISGTEVISQFGGKITSSFQKTLG